MVDGAGGRLDDGERMAPGTWPHLHHLWLLPSLVGQMPKSGVWGLASGPEPSIFPHTHARLRHGHSGCRTSNSSPDIFNHGETSLCLVAWNRPGLYSRTPLARRPRLSSTRLDVDLRVGFN